METVCRDIKNEAVDEKPVLEPNAVEKYQIAEIMRMYPNVDYLMALIYSHALGQTQDRHWRHAR